MKEYFR